MHGIVGAFGIGILLCFATAFLLSLITGFKALKSSLIASAILLIVAIALSPPEPDRLGDLVIELPIYILGLTIGMFGALPGGALGGWLRTKFLRKEV